MQNYGILFSLLFVFFFEKKNQERYGTTPEIENLPVKVQQPNRKNTNA